MSKLTEPLNAENTQSRSQPRRVLRLGVLLLFALLLLGFAFQLDARCVEWVRSESNGPGRWLAGQISHWGDWYGVLALGLGIWFFGLYQKHPGVRKFALVMGLSASLAGLGANGIRAVTGRARPFSASAPGWFGPEKGLRVWTKGARDFQSFPSAHTSVVAGFLAPLALVSLRQRRRRVRVLGVGLALAGIAGMAWARVWVGAHHVSDVTAAALLGVWVGYLVLNKSRLSRSFAF